MLKIDNYYVTTKSTIISPTNSGNIRKSYKDDTRMGHIQRERLPKSKMASSDDRNTFEIVHIARNSEPLPLAKRDETLPCALFLFIGKCMEMIV